jgi:transcriptional regulator with XRE-family HTH domain
MRLGLVLHKWRINAEQSQRQLAKEIGVSHSTLCRFEAGENVDAQTLAAILLWLFQDGEMKEQDGHKS